MKKYLILFLVALLLLPSAMALNLEVEELDSNKPIILEFENSANFDLNITNLGETSNFSIYTFYGSGHSPKEAFEIEGGETKKIDFEVEPPYQLSGTGSVIFDYYISEESTSEKHRGQLSVDKTELSGAFEVGSGQIHPERNSVDIYIENQVDMDFDNLEVIFSSPFFDFEEELSLGPYEKKTFEKELNKKQFEKIKAGFYTIKANVEARGEKTEIEGTIEFRGKEQIKTSRENYGFFINKEKVTKTNEGNVEKEVSVEIQKDIFSRLFTSVSPVPDNKYRNGSTVNYLWTKALGPSEKLEVKTQTNWVLPIIILIVLIAAAIFIRKYLRRHLVVRKTTSFVKSKNDEFALKVSVFIEAKRKPLSNVVVSEKLPPLLKLYKKFGEEKPKRVDDKSKKMEWEFSRLEPGERRVISYVAHSKVKVVGKFALPRTKVLYERDGKVKESTSNRVYFVAEQNSKKGKNSK